MISHEFWVSDTQCIVQCPRPNSKALRRITTPWSVLCRRPSASRLLHRRPAFVIISAYGCRWPKPSGNRATRMDATGDDRPLLKPGATMAQTQAEMTTIQARLAKRYPGEEDLNNHGAQVVHAAETVTGDVRPALRILLSAVAALLLISCANVAGLLLARGSARQFGTRRPRRARYARRREIVLSTGIASRISPAFLLMGGVAGIALGGRHAGEGCCISFRPESRASAKLRLTPRCWPLLSACRC